MTGTLTIYSFFSPFPFLFFFSFSHFTRRGRQNEFEGRAPRSPPPFFSFFSSCPRRSLLRCSEEKPSYSFSFLFVGSGREVRSEVFFLFFSTFLVMAMPAYEKDKMEEKTFFFFFFCRMEVQQSRRREIFFFLPLPFFIGDGRIVGSS